MTINIRVTFFVSILLVVTAITSLKAQLNPFQSMYYQNRYLYNPAMAGINKELNLNLAYRQQWTTFPGSPKIGSLTADFQPTDKVGLGININDDRAGLIRQARIMGTYAYHLPLSDKNQHLSFGLSLGVNDFRINQSEINGDQSDPEISKYNQFKPYVDGDFGIAYTSNTLNIGAAIPNLKSVFFRSSGARFDANRLLFITSVSYKFPFNGDYHTFSLEPLMALRVVKGYSDIFDVGFNLNLDRYGLYLQSVYHTSQNLGVAVGFDQEAYAFNVAYAFETGELNNFSQGGFEFGIKFRLFRKNN